MPIHYIPQWLAASFESVKKTIKPRQYFHIDDAAEPEANKGSPRPSDNFDEDLDEPRTDNLAQTGAKPAVMGLEFDAAVVEARILLPRHLGLVRTCWLRVRQRV